MVFSKRSKIEKDTIVKEKLRLKRYKYYRKGTKSTTPLIQNEN